MHQDVTCARRALAAGAAGYVLKHSAPAELIAAIRAALNGQTYITPALAGEVFQPMQAKPQGGSDPAARLTPRQREILQLLAEGHSIKEIGGILNLSPRTVEFHKYSLMSKLNLKTISALVQYAIKHGITVVEGLNDNISSKNKSKNK